VRPRSVVLAFAVLLASACFIAGNVRTDPVDPAQGITVKARARVHLIDGSTVIFERGFVVRESRLEGKGHRYGLVLGPPSPVDAVLLDSVVAVESYVRSLDASTTVAGSTMAAGGAIAIAVAAVALLVPASAFGSCPTFYSDSAGRAVLEAEGFSYSVAAILEGRDVDRLRARPDSDGVLRLEVRNEALETHFINHLGLLEVRHAANELAVPAPDGKPIVLRGLTAPRTARGRTGQDVFPILAEADGVVFRTDTSVLKRVTEADVTDYIDLEVAVPPGADSVALFLRLRNSLLNTVLFYELMIADRGAYAVDWMTEGLGSLSLAVQMSRFSRTELGLRVSVPDPGAGEWRQVSRVSETGPIAWKDLVVLVPVSHAEGGLQRVRLSFLADDWRIDRVASTGAWRRAEARAVPLTRVIGSDGLADTSAWASLGAPDRRYVETTAGQHFRAEFDPGPYEGPRTFFLAAQGYYQEWVRRDWLARRPVSPSFTPSRAILIEAIRRWRATQDSTERLFYASRIPVR
jgi:hypothetical protein